MDDKLYNQIFLKPRFQLDIQMNASDLLQKINHKINEEAAYKMKLIDNHLFIDISDKESHYWSPQLQIEVESLTENTSKIRGLFGPKPQVWTMFMFMHFAVATAFLIFAIMAYSYWSLNKDIFFPMTMVIVLPILWITLYFLGRVGKSTGQEQMDNLKDFLKKLLRSVNS